MRKVICFVAVGSALALALGPMNSIAAQATSQPSSVALPTAKSSAKKALYKNCTALNKKYKHGVGRANAKDKVSRGKPVKNFTKSTKIYNEAMKYNRGLDRDKDGIACEKH
ncbi:MAG: excalibur calcium-binding domain-containing protein [Micropruina sp.]|uniref:excalibur calcium-binding domain-containing protein n=1 Tax=Micropruina sp. TaxID=2737536 RepID=UPI0039E2D959